MNKRLMEFGAFLGMLFLMIFSVVYIIKYNDLDNFDKINNFNIILGILVILNIVIYFHKILERVFKRKKIGKIIYFLKPDIIISPLFLLILLGVILVLWLNFYFYIRPSFTGLAMIIILSISTLDSIFVYLSETG